jgi:type IV fimbrial biogenesis protein FimT
MPARHQSGFTLIELMVAVAVLFVLTVIAAPSFSTYLDKARVRGAADNVVNLVAQARQGGVKHDRDVSLAITGVDATWCVGANQAVDPAAGDQSAGAVACDCTDADECLVDNQRLVVASSEHAGVTLTSPSSDLTFDGRLGVRSDANTADADASSFDLTSKSGRYVLTVNISPLGQATVCSKAGNILGYPQC